MKTTTSFIGKFFYAIGFLIIIPGMLWLWAINTENLITYPVIDSEITGWVLTIGGIILIIWAMFFLKKYGEGLPMNAYPPPKFVKTGPYRLFRHPIYWGFGLLMVGFFILIGSASGIWLVTPITILGMIALVWGYEAIDIKKRFPDETINTILDLPEKSLESARLSDHLASLFWVIGLLVITNMLTLILVRNAISIFPDPNITTGDFVYQLLPILSFVLLIATPFFLRRKENLRVWSISALLALSISFFFTIIFPKIGAQYLLMDTAGIITIPTYLIFICLWSIFKQSRTMAIFFGLIAISIILLHSEYHGFASIQLVSSMLIFFISVNHHKIWMLLRNGSEQIANSWKEWRFGNIRIINHGFYAGLATFVGILYSGMLVGKAYAWAILIFSITVIVFSALWAQIIEGSEKLKRPFGFYGGVVGILFACPVVWLMGFNGWIILGTVSIAMPWVQAIGRLKCLVNGCCHGRKVENPTIGIRYFHHRTRVCGISDLKGKLIHPTQLYAIIWLFLVGFILLSLWLHSYSFSFIFGIYLIFTGLGRFVEEAYRGEVQTPIIKGLRLYQWTAILTIPVGMVMTLIPGTPILQVSELAWETIFAAIVGGLFTTFAMGVDFPSSNVRFSRLV